MRGKKSPVNQTFLRLIKCRRHSHAVETVWRLFKTVSLSQVIINLTVFHPRIWSLAPSGDLPHGDPERPLRDKQALHQVKVKW